MKERKQRRQRRQISVRNSVIIVDGIGGIAWVLFGIVNLFNNDFGTILAAIFALSVALINIFILYVNKEEEDEMSLRNMDKARSVTMLIWIIILNFGIAFLLIHNSLINIVNILPFALGITELLICLFFFLFEKVGV